MRLISILFACFIIQFQAQAAWVEARTDNFIFRGDVSQKRAKLIVSELEEYRTIIFTLMNVDPEAEIMPVTIYAAKSSGNVQDMTGHAGAAGVYRTSREGPAFILNVSGSFAKDSPARRIAYHEYTHHLVSTYTSIIYPRWFNEGYAEYLSTFEVSKKGRIKIGMPSNSRAYALTRFGFMDMDTLTNSVRSYPYPNNSRKSTNDARARFYAQSWLAVHYIQSTKGYREKLKTYLDALDQPNVPKDVFEQSFGMTPDAFGEILKTYFHKNKFLTLGITLKDDIERPEPETRKLSKAESRFHQGEAVRRFRRSEKGSEISEKYYAKADKEYGTKTGPLSAQIEASRALLALRDKNEDAAFAHVKTALDLAPGDSRVLQVAGHVYLKTYKNTGASETAGHMGKAQDYLKDAMRANPRNMQAHFDYVSTYAVSNQKASKQAIYSAEECARYYRSRNFIGANMRLAEILYKNKQYDAVRPLLKRASIWAGSPRTRNFARKQLERLP